MALPINLDWLTRKTISLSWKCQWNNQTAFHPSINQVIRQLVSVTNNSWGDDWQNENQKCQTLWDSPASPSLVLMLRQIVRFHFRANPRSCALSPHGIHVLPVPLDKRTSTKKGLDRWSLSLWAGTYYGDGVPKPPLRVPGHRTLAGVPPLCPQTRLATV